MAWGRARVRVFCFTKGFLSKIECHELTGSLKQIERHCHWIDRIGRRPTMPRTQVNTCAVIMQMWPVVDVDCAVVPCIFLADAKKPSVSEYLCHAHPRAMHVPVRMPAHMWACVRNVSTRTPMHVPTCAYARAHVYVSSYTLVHTGLPTRLRQMSTPHVQSTSPQHT